MFIHKGAIYRRAKSELTFDDLWEFWLEGDPWGSQPLKDEMWTLQRFMRNATDEEVEARARENLEEKHKAALRQRYENSLSGMERLEGKDCYRVMELEQGVDPTKVDPLGTYWAYRKSGSGSYWGTGGQKQWVIYRGRIDTKNIDKNTTAMNNVLYPEEYEVSFIEGSPIYVYDVTIGGRQMYTIPIKDIRTC